MLEMVNQKDNAKSVEAFQKYANYLRDEEKFDEVAGPGQTALGIGAGRPRGVVDRRMLLSGEAASTRPRKTT